MSESDIERIAQEVSPEAAEKVMRAFGGASLYIPRVPGPHHKLSIAVGHVDAKKIARLIGPGTIQVPTGARARIDRQGAEIEALVRAGRPQSEIARRLGCSVRTVSRRAQRTRQTDRATARA